ncbi:hypothetical protein FNU76_02535 [Chitinimonas arctica]|uniref:Uncharacterized protein n=1 Tax=Chitinimonas arctica TaxID=2594795 RepID=A0A516SAZ3_9NEIS|nr:hypothetical protein [Chitinimonas arctica]QDQ25319.1 hypothetical protein FNU76_02535 [Chitinimonas arctica]
MYLDASTLSGGHTDDDALIELEYHNANLAVRADIAEMHLKALQRDTAIAIAALRCIAKAEMAPLAAVAADALRQMVTV